MDLGGIGSFILDLSKTVFEAKKAFQKKHDTDTYIKVLEDSFEELKIKCQELEQENIKLKQKFEPTYYHYKVIEMFDDDWMCDYYKMQEFVKGNRLNEHALYQLIDENIIAHYTYDGDEDYEILEENRSKAIDILLKFNENEKGD